MSKKRKSRLKRRLAIFVPISLFIILYFIFSLAYYAFNIYSLTTERHNLEMQYEQLLEEAEQLNIEIQKLNDPEYLARFARENYSYSKDGEYIIKLKDNINQTNEVIDQTELEINKNYIIMSLMIIILLVFIYIIRSNNKRKKQIKKNES